VTYSVAMTEGINEVLVRHLVRADDQEDLCFALWKPSAGLNRTSALINAVILPEPGDREVHGNASFNPQYVERAVAAALAAGSGIAFLHSHPASGWQAMSSDDVRAEQGLAPTIAGATRLPVVGLTLAAGDGAWSARFWPRVGPKQFERHWCTTVRVLGRRLRVHYNDQLLPAPRHRVNQTRTLQAWGPDAHRHLTRLRVGVAGLGSVGSIIAEAVARTGTQHAQLLDYQSIEELNLDRTLHATHDDAIQKEAKVAVAARAMMKSATAEGFRVDADDWSICEEKGYRRALDCDVIFSCVDRPWPRSVLNYIAFAHLIPVVDGGIFVGRTPAGKLRGADWKAHVIGPEHRCMLCLGQYDPGFVAADKRGDLDDPRYLEPLAIDHPLRANENVFGFSLGVASLEFLQFLLLAIGPLGLGTPGSQNYHMVSGTIDLDPRSCDPGCIFPELTAAGDTQPSGTDTHKAAESARAERQGSRRLRGISRWLRSLTRTLIGFQG